MAEPRKRSRPSRIRHRIEAQCETEAEKEALSRRFQRMRELLTPGGARFADNGVVLNTMFDIVEQEFAGQPTPCSSAPPSALSPSMMRNSGETLAVALLYSEKYLANMNNCYVMPCMEGMYSGDDNADDSSLFMCERHALTDLLDGLKAPCSCGMIRSPWTLDSIIQVIYIDSS